MDDPTPTLAGLDGAALDLALAQMNAADDEARARLARPEALAQAALWYARRGVAVFPCIPNGKRPATSHGLLDATTDADQVRAWWTAQPAANIGLPTGHLFDVIDVDPHPDDPLKAYRNLATLREAGYLDDTVGRVATPRPGVHHYVTPTGIGNGAALLPGIDYRGLGGYVVAPPSRIDGALYQWTTPLRIT